MKKENTLRQGTKNYFKNWDVEIFCGNSLFCSAPLQASSASAQECSREGERYNLLILVSKFRS
jgi:hypothetical protein